MHLTSSRFVLLAGLAAALACGTASAQTWPAKPIRLVVPFAAGGANDLMARAAAEGASKALGQPIVVDNKPGAGATLGADIVAKSAPDGYTFLVSAAGVISNSMIKKHLPYKDSDLVPVAMIGLAPSVILVPADAPYKDLKEFIAASKNGAGFHWATAGTGSTPHFVEGMLETRVRRQARCRALQERLGVASPRCSASRSRPRPRPASSRCPYLEARQAEGAGQHLDHAHLGLPGTLHGLGAGLPGVCASPTGPACMRRTARPTRSSTR